MDSPRRSPASPFALVLDSNGSMLRVSKVKELRPADYTVLGWTVADIGAAVESLVRKGVAFERYDWIPQDADGIWTSPDGTKVAWFKDPDGNLLSVKQF